MLSLIFSPFRETKRGIQSYVRALRWLKQNPKYWFLLSLPMLVGTTIFVVATYFILTKDFSLPFLARDGVLASETYGFWATVWSYITSALIKILSFILALVFTLLFSNILGAPIYEWVSVAVERDVTGRAVAEPSFWQGIKLIGEEIKKIIFIILVSTILFFIPIVNIFSLLVTAWLVGWDFYDYPMVRAGQTFKQRLKTVSSDGWAVLGLGLWLMIPFVQIFLAPPAIVAGTLLYCETNKFSTKKKEIAP